MKKILTVFLCFILIFTFTACEEEGETLPDEITVAKPGYTCESYVLYNGFDIEFKLTVTGGGIFSAEMLTPATLKGTKFNFDNGRLDIKFLELSSEKAISPNHESMATLLNGIFLKITTGSLTVPLKDGAYSITGTSDNFPYTINFNKEGYPVKLKMPEAGLEAIFSKFEAMK